MKVLKTIIIMMGLFLFPAYAFSANPGYMRISFLNGDVQVKTPEAGDWGLASINTPLAEGDQVWVPAGSRAELQLNTGTYVRLDQNSSLQILSMDRVSSQFYLSQGHAYIIHKTPSGSVLQIDTPDASTRSFDSATFRIDVSDSYTDVAAYKGYVETENTLGRARINAGQMVSLGQNSYGEVAPLGLADDWEGWNKMRNKRLSRRDGGVRYLPAELRVYSDDLDSSGRWVRVPEYGYVWTPTVGAGANWSPYREGRWIWRDGEYVWVASEPWGWAPYHYGRWSYITSVGWCWAPPAAGAVYWAPAYVGWVRTPDYVAWVPLAPGEVYYGRGNYGPHSVNITNVNITQVNVTNVYKNVYVNNGVTVVNRNTFNTPSPRIVNLNRNVIQKNIFVKNNISIGAPDIKPARASYFPSARAIVPARLPPLPVRNVRVQELKRERPLVRSKDKSVLAPGTRQVNLPVHVVTTPRTPGRGRPALRPALPAESGRPRAAGSTTPGSEKPQVQPAEKGKARAPVAPTSRGASPWGSPRENRNVGSPGVPVPTAAQPAARSKPLAPGTPAPRGEKPQGHPAGLGKPEAPGGPRPRGNKPEAQPAERSRSAAPPVQAPRVERPQAQPGERSRPATPPAQAPRVERPQVRPGERSRPAAPPAQASRAERPQVQPAERSKPAAPPAQAPRSERPQFQPAGKGKAAVPGGPVPKEKPPQATAKEKPKHREPGDSGAKDERNPPQNRQ